ncbi:enoyl-CoA hydratase/isomerase family protein [Variovorax sp. WS11]|uniref:enoyl-CoA hydratase/isomerase family protein n=1 Tax=Variovorax sp. WS11 TaxID=1105204 RepID=UPI002158CAE1|nr:enoyl-CoA hydratase/isomerase family protein [Variovorax sp. WS11]
MARIEFARPDRANSLRPSELEALHRCLDVAEARPEVHVLVITGAGRYFSAGFDLASLVERTRGAVAAEQLQSDFERLANRIEATRLITLAAINGPAIGGATDLALACDLRIGSEHTAMTMPAASFGLPLYASALRRFATRLGLTQAKWLVLTAAPLDANAMLTAGFLSEVVAADRFEERVSALTGRLASMPGGTLSAMKRALNAASPGWDDSAAQRAHRTLVDAVDGDLIAKRIADAVAQRNS